tara:strand:- start:1278 stop:2705 length:1428 start_codon:yes stop_codon:yes gene_type:complete
MPTTTTAISYCQGASSSALTATPSLGNTLRWYSQATGTSSFTAPTPSTASVGSQTYYVAQFNATTGCEGPQVAIAIQVTSLLPPPVATATLNYCKGDPAGQLAANALPGSKLVWYDIDGITVLSAAPTPSTAVVGSYTYYVAQETLAGGCEGAQTAITVDVTEVVLSIFHTDNILCSGDAQGDLWVDITSGLAPYSFIWGNGSVSDSIFDITAGSYSVFITDANGCSASNSITVNEPDPISYTYLLEDVSCYGDSTGTIDLTITGGTPSYQITWSNQENTPVIDSLYADVYSFYILDGLGCKLIDSLEIQSPMPLEVQLDTLLPTCELVNDGAINAYITGGTYPYIFELNGQIELLPLDSVGTGSYRYVVTDLNGCQDSNQFFLGTKQEQCFLIPNMFSPNNDGFNDELRLKHSDWSIYTMSIYNPIGQLVYQADESGSGWDGYSNGQPMPTGDYYYMLSTNEGQKIYGYVTLIR